MREKNILLPSILLILLQEVLSSSSSSSSSSDDTTKDDFFKAFNAKKTLPIKVVRRVTDYTNKYALHNNQDGQAFSKQKEFMIPQQLIALTHPPCHNLSTDRYTYKICPFTNITQDQIGQPLNPTSKRIGHFRLGYWDGKWIIRDDKIVGISYVRDDCLSTSRKSVVSLSCHNSTTQMVNMTETKLCEYWFDMRIADTICHHGALGVYGMINEKRRRQWDIIFTLWKQSHISTAEYKELVNMIWLESGFKLSDMMAN